MPWPRRPARDRVGRIGAIKYDSEFPAGGLVPVAESRTGLARTWLHVLLLKQAEKHRCQTVAVNLDPLTAASTIRSLLKLSEAEEGILLPDSR